MASSSHRPTSATWIGLVLGVVLLVAMIGFAVLLPRAEGHSAESLPALPDTLPGGWEALENASPPDQADQADYEDQQRAALAYVNQVFGTVYDNESTEFRAYVDDAGQALVTATLFDSAGGAFAPPNGVADPEAFGLDRAPVELTREGSAVCIANYQSAAQAGDATSQASDVPLSVSCQAPVGDDGEQTVQLGSQSMSAADTAALLGDLADSLA